MNTIGISPLGKHLLVDITPKEQVTAAGIVLPTAVQGAASHTDGVVVDRGEDCTDSRFQPGAAIYVVKWACPAIPKGGRSYRLVLESDVLALLDSTPAVMPDPKPAIGPIEPY
jgi:co-chaperonin GroES (HSP10)